MRINVRRPTKLLGNRSGSAMVEFAIGSGILVLAFTGAFQFGFTFYRYNNLVTAVTAGARYASLLPYDSTTTTPSTTFATAVKNMVVYGNPAGGTTPVMTGLTTANVTLTPEPFVNGVPSKMTVKITGYTIDSIFDSVTCNGKPRVTFPYQGIWSP
jgi:Flp pilus assembly protein TadG